MRRIPLHIWTTGLVVWLVMSVIIAFQIDVGGLYSGTGVLVGPAVLWIMVSNLFWPLILPLLSRATERWPPQRTNLRWWIPLLFLSGLITAVIHAFVAIAVAVPMGPFPELSWAELFTGVRAYLAVGLHMELAVYFALVGTVVAWRAHREIRERTERSAELEVQLSRAKLHTLQSRIQPHFFFNSLNTVSMMVRSGEDSAAVQTLSDLADLMRDALRDVDSTESTLSEEMRLVRRYLSIEKARFPDRLDWTVEWEEGLGDLALPPLLLQPLVENAITHGIARNPDAGNVTVVARHDPEDLVLEVRDDGPVAEGAQGSEQSAGHGVGLENVRHRVEAFFGGGDLSLVREGDHTVARIRIPWSLAEDL